MSKESLQDWLASNDGFKRQFNHLWIESVAQQFIALKEGRELFDGAHNWNYLLTCASLLAQSEKGEIQSIALRIAQHCLECSSTNTVQKDAAAVVLDTLANRPTIQLAERRDLLEVGYTERLPFPLLQDWTRRHFENSILLPNSQRLEVNHFQNAFWTLANNNDWVSVSAPTSAGKSFIVERWFVEFLRSNPAANVVYVVPTRALIQQVQNDLEDLLKSEGLENVAVVTLPVGRAIAENKTNVFVFTQERFHMLLSEREISMTFDLLVIDEAQKIGDNYRGVLLQQAIESVTLKNPKCRVLFACPMATNPELLLEDAPEQARKTPLSREDVMVGQNLIWATQVRGHPKKWCIDLMVDSEPVNIGQIILESSPSHETKRLSFVAQALSNPNGGNIVYVNGASEAETVAKQLYGLLGDGTFDAAKDPDVKNLIDLIRKTIHPKYFLINVLSKGIAFHYGNIPLLIRTEIERLFSLNKIKYLICTSTLIEGVNLPCQSIFIRGPKKGRKTHMDHSDFWNLAGRAGRWGKEFQGNVICVDPNKVTVWKKGTPRARTKYRMSRTSDIVLSQRNDLLKFIEDGTPRIQAAAEPNLEYVFSYLVTSYIQNGSIKGSVWSKRYNAQFIDMLDEKISTVLGAIKIPKEIILKNPGISPLAMDALLGYFEERTNVRKEAIEDLIPIPPEDGDTEEVLTQYSKILHRINTHLAYYAFGKGKRVRQLALLIRNWMKGYPLARLITSREKYYTERGDSFNLGRLIRDTMDDVEEYARFKAPKFLSCYMDILKLHLINANRTDLSERVIDLNVLLEFGVSQDTQLSLMGLGLSRSTAVTLSEIINDDSLDEKGCLVWLWQNKWMTEDMPELIKREISNLLVKKNKDLPSEN